MKKIVTSLFLLFMLVNVHGQYMSFFGDSTWEFHVTYLTNPPEDYIDYPPQMLNPLNVYCRTHYFKYDKSSTDGNQHFRPISPYSGGFPWIHTSVYEDTALGRLYVDTNDNDGNQAIIVCDLSLSESDTFILKDPCWYEGAIFPGHPEWIYDTVGDRSMVVDSVRYVAGRKTIFLSLIDHLDDYFFGNEYAGQHPDHQFTIRFMEGIGATYGSLPGCRWPAAGADLHPSLGLMLCMYKDGSMVYLADDSLGCEQTCVSVPKYPQLTINLYPNPATQYVVLDMSTGEEMNGLVEITDMLGRVCYQQRAEGTRCQISVSDFPTGLYFLTYSNGKNKVSKKFLKE